MPHHRVPLGIELAGRGMDVAICQTAAHHGILRRIHYLLYLYERGSRTDERRELPLYDALSLRKSGAGTYRRSRRTLSGENDCMRRSRRIEEKKAQIAEEYTEDSIPSNEEMMKILSFLLFYISKMP